MVTQWAINGCSFYSHVTNCSIRHHSHGPRLQRFPQYPHWCLVKATWEPETSEIKPGKISRLTYISKVRSIKNGEFKEIHGLQWETHGIKLINNNMIWGVSENDVLRQKHALFYRENDDACVWILWYLKSLVVSTPFFDTPWLIKLEIFGGTQFSSRCFAT